MRLLLCLLILVSITSNGAEAQRSRERPPKPNFINVQIFGTGADVVRVSPLRGNRCLPDMAIRINAPKEAFFANNQRELEGLWPQILSHVQQSCPEAEAIEIEGAGRGRSVYKGSAKASSGWSLVHDRTPLQIAIEDADRQTIRFEDTRQLDAVMQRHTPMFGGTDTPDAATLTSRIEGRKAKLADERFDQFSRELRAIPSTVAGLDLLGSVGVPMFKTLETRYASSVPKFRDAVDSRAREIRAGVLSQVDQELSSSTTGWREAIAKIALIQKRETELVSRIPEIKDRAAQALTNLETKLPEHFADFKSFLSSAGDDWDSLARLNVERDKLASAAGLIASLKPYLVLIDERRAELLTQLQGRSIQELSEMGKGFEDIEAVIDTGEELAKKLSAAGAVDAAAQTRQATSARVNQLAEQGYDTFAQGLATLPPTGASRAQLSTIADEYAGLEANVPAFSLYVDLAESRIGEIEAKVCDDAARAFGNDALLAQSISLKEGVEPLKGLVCQMALADHKLSVATTTWSWLMSFFGSDIAVQYVSASGDVTEITLRPAATSSNPRALVGYQTKNIDGDARTLTEADWHMLAEELLLPPPSGKPDQDGRTGCDIHAADPDDPKKRAPGVKDEALDLKRGLEACIAAVEERPTDPVQLYQLGRLLKQAGNEDLAKTYLESAAASEHAAALAKLGDLQSSHEDQTKLAIKNYKRAVRGGYEPAKQQIALLDITEPIDFAKDSPTSGTFKLLCLIENTSYTVGGDVHDVWMSELTGEIDLDNSEARFDYDKMPGTNDKKLIERGRSYRVSSDPSTWSIPVAAIGGEEGSYSLSIGKRDLKVEHRQPMILGNLLGFPIRASMSVTGECMQNF